MKKTTIGGQALIEGLMMIGPENAAIALRKPDGEIHVEKRPLPTKSKYSKVPLLRGVVGLFSQMVLGVKALMFSAEFVEIEDKDAEPSKIDMFIERLFKDKFKDAAIYFSVIVSFAFSIGLFMLLPHVIATFLGFSKGTSGDFFTPGVIIYNLVEGCVRIFLFFLYLFLVSKMNDIKRVWQYHGAEHKTIHCYENGDELTVENVRKYTTRHPRCGTSFLFLVMIVSILVFSLLPLINVVVNVLLRLVLVPFVAGLSYEIIKFAGRSESPIMKLINVPGMAFQAFTTKEPDDSMIEVAIEAFKNVMVEDKDADKW